ncbi:MAG: TIGR00341 family protein [Alphaproteobacteria bacterium]
MTQRIVYILSPQGKQDLLDSKEFCGDVNVIDSWKISCGNDQQCNAFLVNADDVQQFTDNAKKLIENETITRLVVANVEASLPMSESEKEEEEERQNTPWFFSRISRDELYNDILGGATLNANYLLLTFFATLVGAIALMTDNVPIMIGAMVIAPLLGPNIGLAFAVAVGDLSLVKKFLHTGMAGLAIALMLASVIGMIFSLPEEGVLIQLTKVGYESLLVALCSGAVGVIALAQPGTSNMVGVMVAVALLPPAVATGLFAGAGAWAQAGHSGLLLAINVVCINLAAQMAFLLMRVRPVMRHWMEEKNAQKTFYKHLSLSCILLFGFALLLVWVNEF